MTDKTAITGDYTDIKFVKTRKVAVISVEIPIEAATAFVAAFGAPNPATGVPVALARLQSQPEAQKAEKPERKWSDMPRSQQAALKCEDEDFANYVCSLYTAAALAKLGGVVGCVRNYCNVSSRRDLDTDAEAAKKWDRLYSNFQLYRRGAAA